MRFNHSTSWENLASLIVSPLIIPKSLSEVDLQSPQLNKLHEVGLACIWFSTQSWSNNRFGPYVLSYSSTDLVLGPLAELGLHNGARCFLAGSPSLTSWAANEYNFSEVAFSDIVRSDKSDRIDLLVPSPVPLTSCIDVVDAHSSFGPAGKANFARARLLALVLARKVHRFDVSLTKPLGLPEAANNLLDQLSSSRLKGYLDGCSKYSGMSAGEITSQALHEVIDGNRAAAKMTMACVGDVEDMAISLTSIINTHFNTSLSAEQVLKG